MVTRKTDKPYRGKANLDVLFGDTQLSPNTININDIVLPSHQPRRYFDSEKLEQLKSSIKQHGILEPLLVRALTEGKYELVAGERRLRASQSLGLTEIPVVIKEFTDQEALQVALIENLQREDLNPVEETEGILQLLSIQLNLSVSDVIAQLYRMQNDKVRVNGNVSIKHDSTVIIQLFESLAMKWESFIRTRLPLLKLPPDILSVLRAGQLAYTKAIALSKLKDEQQRVELLQESIELNLSLREIKERIKELDKGETKESISAKIDVTVKQIKKKKLWETEPKKWEKVEKLLEKINLLLED